MLSKLEKEEGIKVPELYKLGFAHNNCGGFCFRAGIGHFKHLLETKPDLYKFHEDKEQELREYLGRDDISILRRTKNRQKYNITLKKLREELESQHVQLSIEDLLDIGGCGCFVDDDENMNFED